MRKHKTILLALVWLTFVGLGVHNVTRTHNILKFKDIQLKSTSTDLLNLEVKYDLLNKQLEQKNIDAKKAKELEQQKNELQKQLDEAQKQLQAKAQQKDAEQKRLAQAASLSGTAYAASGNQYKDYIYAHESGNCPTKWQGQHTCPSGFVALYDPSTAGVGYGLCQSTPAIKMADSSRGGGPDWRTSYATQDSWCTFYANSRYGGWEQAYNHWLVYHSW